MLITEDEVRSKKRTRDGLVGWREEKIVEIRGTTEAFYIREYLLGEFGNLTIRILLSVEVVFDEHP